MKALKFSKSYILNNKLQTAGIAISVVGIGVYILAPTIATAIVGPSLLNSTFAYLGASSLGTIVYGVLGSATTVVTHSSGAAILTSSAGYVAGTIGTTAAVIGGVMTGAVATAIGSLGLAGVSAITHANAIAATTTTVANVGGALFCGGYAAVAVSSMWNQAWELDEVNQSIYSK